MKLLLETLRGVALVTLWFPIKLIRIFAAIVILSPLIMGINVTNLIVALAAGLVFVSMPRFHRWLRRQPA